MEGYFRSLHESFRSENHNLTKRTISHITNYFLEELEEDELDSYILTIFNASHGLLAFINNAASHKRFEPAISKALELLYTLVGNFPKFVRGYLEQIVKTCLFVCRVNVGSLTKQKALQIIQMIITSREYNLDEGLVVEIYSVIYNALKTQQSDTFTSEIVVVIGYIIKHFKQVITEEDKCELLKYIISILAFASKDKKPTLSEGLFTCVCELLYCTVPHESEREKLYRFLKEFANLVHDSKAKKNASRAALHLFAEHIGLFAELVRRDASYWNNTLRAWLNVGSDNFKAGSRALDKFYLELGKDLRSREVFNEIIAIFKADFSDSHIATNKLRLSIRGLGYFAENFKSFSTSAEIYGTFVFLMQNMEHLYILNANPKSDCIDNLPDYIQTLSYYTKQIDELNGVHLSFLQKITVTMLRLFPKLSMFHHNLVVEALVINMYCIHKSKSSLSGFLHAVIYQGVMWTCSHNLAREIEILPENQHLVTYKTYLPLWLGLLKMPNLIKKLEIDETSCRIIQDTFVDELIKTLLVLVNKLNVNVKRQEEHDTIDPLNLTAEKIDDFVIFVNLVDFYVELLGEIKPQLFHKWIISYSTHLIGKSIKYPLVSGFYKLLSADLKLCDSLDYFTEQRLQREEVNSLFESFKIYLTNVIPRIQSTGDDLQLACMQVVLSAPIALINAVHADYSLVFISVFTFGQNYLSLAEEGVKTIEKWLALLPPDVMNPLLKRVLPHLDYYLRTRAFSTKAEGTGTATRKGFRKRQVNVETRPELLRLQHNVLRLFARVNSEVCWDFVNANVTLEPVVFGKKPLLKVQLKDDFGLHLDRFMPRILELSLYCSNRKTRGTACQLLHSSIMIMLEKCVHLGSNTSELNSLLEKIAEAVLILACDCDNTIKNMYDPLAKQMVHWYSSPKQLGSKHTDIILETLFNKISNPNNAKLRDLSAQCLKEFVAWTIKQSNKQKSLQRNAHNIDKIIDKVRYFSTHPDPAKRLSAALIFNNVYTVLREEDYLLNLYWLDLLYTFVVNLSLEHSNSNEECLVQVNAALDHLLRVFIEREYLFNSSAKEEVRATPPKFEGNMLKHVAKFLLEHTTSLSCNCRVKCMEMFFKLAPLVHGSSEKQIVEESRELFFEAYTHDLNKTLEECEGSFKWFYSLLCLIDAHVFVMRRGLLREYSYASSKLSGVIQNEVIGKWRGLENPRSVIKGVITTDLKEEYSIIRGLLRDRIYDLTIVQLENEHYFTPEYFNCALWNFLYYSVFEFYTNDEKLTAKNQRLISLLSKLPQAMEFLVEIHENLRNKLQGPNNFEANITQGDRQILRSILKFRHNLKLNVEIDFVPKFFTDLLEERSEILYVRKMHATNYDYFNLKLQLALETQLSEFIAKLCDKRITKCLETHETKMYGQQIFGLFERTTVETLTRVANFEVFLNTSLEALDVKYVYYYVCNILNYVNDHMSDFGNEIRSNLIRVIAKFWCKFQTIFIDNSYQVILGIDLIEKMAFIAGKINNDVILEWVLALFNFKVDTKEENYEFIKRMIYGLGLTAGKGTDERVGKVLSSKKENLLNTLENDPNIVCTTLMINSYIEAAQHSKSIDVLKHGLHLLVTMENDLDGDLDISRIFVEHTTIELQLETLQEIYAMCFLEYTYNEKMKLAGNLSQFLRSCSYEAFETFYIRNVREIEAKFKEDIDSKITACILTMTLFARVDSEKFNSKSCPITHELYGDVKTGRELIKGFFVILLSAQKEVKEYGESFRLYQCCAYNALVSVICCSRKDDISFYAKLFKEDIFDRLVTEKSYNFDVEVDEVPKRKKVLVGIRSELHARRGEPERKTRYIESQHIFKSTLSEDILRYDFSNMTVRTQSDLLEETGRSTDLQVELSGEEIDQHECMPHICGLIKHLDEMNLIAESDKPELWITCIRNLLLNERHLNVKLFWAKIIANNQELLKGQAKWLIGPIIKVITDNQQINCINSFVIDMVVMLLTTWSEVDVSEVDREYPSKLLDFLMRHVYSESTEIFKYNIVMLGLAVERWRSSYEAPYGLILEKLSTVTSDKAKCIIPVHLINILLVNDIVPWQSKMKDFMKSLVNTLDSELRKIYSAGAETIGLALKFTSEHEVYSVNLERFAKLVTGKLQGIKSDVKQVYCLEAMAKNYPVICSEFLSKIINYITDENTEFKCITLRILLRCFEKVCEMEGLAKIDLEALLKDSSTEVQVLTLELINKSVDELNISAIKPIVKIVATFLSNKNPISRSTMYDILTAVYKKFCLSEDELCLDVVSLCREVLLQGLTEDEPEIEEKLIKFWVANEVLPKKIDAKILYVLKDMYKTTTEDSYLNYTSYILLSNLRTDLSEAMFEQPLDECTFSDYELSTYWKDRHLSMMPLFASQSQDNLLRATQTLQFEATQRNTIASQRATFLETGSSFAFRREHAIKNPNDLVISNKYKIIARRFNKDKSQVSKFHAGREIKKKAKQRELRREAVKKRDNDIRIYRKYRLGDLPDVEIQFSAVVLPLQELAKDDPYIARLLYTSLFDSALESTRSEDFVAKSSEAINFIFNNSSNYTPALIATLLDIALKYKESIQFEPSVISRVCQGSGLMSMGCLLIEEYINALPAEEPPTKRIKGVEIDNKTLHWVKLAELYKAMEDWDVVHSIFLYKMNCSEATVEAIKFESSGLWKNASGSYRRLIQEEEDNDRKDFYFESFFKCVSELSKWKDLTDCIDNFVTPGDTWGNLWGSEWNKEKLFPYYLKAQIRRALEDVPLKNGLSERLNLDLQDKERSAFLKDNHSEDLAFLGIVEKDFLISRSFLQIFVSNFLVNWSYTNPLFTLLRVQKLLNMRNVMDISLFINDYDNLTKQNYKSALNLICGAWEKSSEEGFISISQSESRNVYRKEFAQLIKEKLSDLRLEIDDLAAANSRINSTMFKLDMKLVDTAVNSNHYYVAQKYIQAAQKNDGLENLEYNLFYSKVVCLNAMLHDDTNKVARKFDAAFKLTEKCLENDLLKTNQSLYLQTNEHYFKITQEFARMCRDEGGVENLLVKLGLPPVNDLEKSGIEAFSNSLFRCERTGNPTKVLGDHFSKLAYYMLGKGEGGERELMLFTLRGMKYESNEAILLFSYLLNMERLAELKDVFKEETSNLPVWLFLKWIPQLLSYVGTVKVEAIYDIIVNIAKEYPNALIYDYKIAKENFKFENVENADVCRKLCEKLDKLLENPLLDNMLKSLNSVCTPGVIVSTAARKLSKTLRVSEEKFQCEGKAILEDLFETKYNYYRQDSVRGKLFSNVEKYKKDFTSIIKSKFNPKTLEPKLKALENNDEKSIRSSDIGQYSPWLKNFHGVDYDQEIEIPGQYDGGKRPLLQYHVKLAGFASDVKVMESLRCPIKITMIGSNTKEYEFLVKYAEDLRQDQRIEQIFKLMNGILNNNSACCKRKLNIFTYEVIPLTKNLGIIEWVGETKKLRDFIEDGIPKAKDKVQFQKIGNEYVDWMKKLTRKKNASDFEAYINSMMKIGRTDVCANYQALVNKVPQYALKQSLWNISVDTENMFALREVFVKSYAIMCVSNWLLGIGDRHLSNILISLKDGRALGIDFGHAFGTATELQIPELIPFRLTPQILNVMQPHNEHGALQESMVHALKALLESRDVLLATMEVFIREPTLNWFESADVEYPKKKIRLARRKLHGVNPREITMEEVRGRQNEDARFKEKLLEFVKGYSDNYRASVGEENLTPEEQVRCLLDQATDQNLLGRMFRGWEPWV